METGTRAPTSGTTQSVPTSSARETRATRPSASSIRWTSSGSGDPGTGSPTAMRVPAGSWRVIRRETGPSETTVITSAVRSGAETNEWVWRHSRQRAMPRMVPSRPASARRIRCTVSSWQTSQRICAE